MNNEMERNEAEVATAREHPPAIANRKGNFRNCCAVQIHTHTDTLTLTFKYTINMWRLFMLAVKIIFYQLSVLFA